MSMRCSDKVVMPFMASFSLDQLSHRVYYANWVVAAEDLVICYAIGGCSNALHDYFLT